MNTSASFTACGQFRLTLFRSWDLALPAACFVLFNPSVASAADRDPTDRKGEGFARRLGCGGYWFVNCYAFIATKPKHLKAAGYPTGGADNDAAILRCARAAHASGGPVIVAWGRLGAGLARPNEVARMLKAEGIPLTCLARIGGGLPAHPLMLGYDAIKDGLTPWTP